MNLKALFLSGRFLPGRFLAGLLLLPIILCACASPSRPLEYYLLESGAGAGDMQQELQAAPVTIRLQELQLARYLSQSSLTLLRGDHSVYYTSNHVWAEPLQYGIKRALSQDLDGREVRLLLEDEPSSARQEYDLRLQIDNLSATDDSRALLSGRFWLQQGETLIAAQSFQLSETLSADGYGHAVAQQRALMARLAQLILASMPTALLQGAAE